LLLDVDVDYKKSFAKTLNLNVGYSLSQSLHNDLDQFDIQTHRISAKLEVDIATKTSAGVNLNAVDSRLDGKDFIDLKQLSPFIGHYVSKQAFVRSAFDFTYKRFPGRRRRDADAGAFNLDLYYFIHGPRHYLIGGYKYKRENAASSSFDYDAHRYKFRWIRRFSPLGTPAKLKVSWRYENRDYDETSASIGERRKDKRHRWSADLEMPLSAKTSVFIEYEYRDYHSNLASAEYTETLITLGLNHTFF